MRLIGVNDDAVSEMVETILLIAIAVTVCSLLYFYVLPDTSPSNQPSVTIVGTLEGNESENACIILTHHGGEALELDTKIVLTIGEVVNEMTAGDLLDEESSEDGLWNLGERLIYPAGDITSLSIEVAVIDTESNTVLMSGVLKE
jgi:FlaG/FlaF family flagellin (archaellin)